MAEWKKVIVSGSQAELAAVSASIGVLVGSNQQITTNPSTTFLSGSFSGSFVGDGSGLTGVSASSLLYSASSGEGISPFSFDGSSNVTVSVSGAAQLSDNAVTKWNDTDGKFVDSNITDNGSLVNINSATNITGSVNVTGSSVTLNSTTFSVEIDSIPFIQAGLGSGVEIADSNGNPSFDSDIRYLQDSASANSVLWNDRQLVKSDGTTVTVDWENGTFTGSFTGSFIGDLTGTAFRMMFSYIAA